MNSSWLIAVLASIGCAGPTTPFGAINKISITADYVPQVETPTSAIEFQPTRQVLHDSASFSVIIEDPKGVPEDSALQLTYNNLDMTGKFKASASREFLNPDRTRVKFTMAGLRLPPQRDNKVMVSYQRDPAAPVQRARYRPPQCNALARERLKRVAGFTVDESLLQTIENTAAEKDINPKLVAGLIAQESSFNPRTVSRNRALGLTQITPIGETEILRRMPASADLPQYPGIDQMALWRVRMGIAQGTINEYNEWRLNPRHSVAGGVEYLKYLAEYWNRPAKQRLISRHAPQMQMNELILASYNSGAARVSRAIEKEGPHWLKSETLNEARKYVWRVTSYCDHIEED